MSDYSVNNEYYHTAVFLALLLVELRKTCITGKALVSTEVAREKRINESHARNESVHVSGQHAVSSRPKRACFDVH